MAAEVDLDEAVRAAVGGLEPRNVWKRFGEILRIARPSKQEGKIRQYILETAKGLRLKGEAVAEDGAGNIVLRLAATAGHEKAPGVILQAHLDMVCERDADSPYDAAEGRIRAVRDGEWLGADGTTLGADNGIAVAAMLAVVEEQFEHGPIELLFTLDEETGLTGAANLDPAILRGRILLNLDSETDGVVCVGCAGGATSTHTIQTTACRMRGLFAGVRVSLTGAAGGHSGADIHLNRANAIRELARVFGGAVAERRVWIAKVHGGNMRNAIPRECAIETAVEREAMADIEERAAKGMELVRRQFGHEPNLALKFERIEAPARAAGSEASGKLLRMLRGLPSGVLGMSLDLPGLVETSNNLAVARTAATEETITFEVTTSSRSSLAPALKETLGSVRAVAELAGAKVSETEGYPGWKPNMQSKALALLAKAHEKVNGTPPRVEAVHAGLECGLLGEKIPGLDMASFGPTVHDPHSPRERVHIPAVERFYKWLIATLELAAKG